MSTRVEGEGWLTAPMECDNCGHVWVAVAPVPTPKLECGKCGHMQERPPFESEDEDATD